MTILDQLAEKAGERMRSAREQVGFPEMTERARACRRPSHAFSGALSSPGLSFICEVKRASPSKGLIDPVFDYMQIARDYEEAGAECRVSRSRTGSSARTTSSGRSAGRYRAP